MFKLWFYIGVYPSIASSSTESKSWLCFVSVVVGRQESNDWRSSAIGGFPHWKGKHIHTTLFNSVGNLIFVHVLMIEIIEKKCHSITINNWKHV